MAKNMGFETENTDNYAGAVYYGTGTEYVDVLTHVDVVPAGDGWDTDPFQMVIKTAWPTAAASLTIRALPSSLSTA